MKFRIVCTEHGNMPVISAGRFIPTEASLVLSDWPTASKPNGDWEIDESNLYCTGMQSHDGWEHEFKIEVVK